MPWKTLCGMPPNEKALTLRVPNGAWRSETVITDIDGNEKFVVLNVNKSMGSYEIVFGDLQGRRLCCVRRKMMRAYWRDGYYFCTYRPNYPGQSRSWPSLLYLQGGQC